MVKIYQTFIVVSFLFFTGCLLGWFLELLFRRFISSSNPEHLWVNPGFLTGPWLPLYGFGVVALYFMSLIEHAVISVGSGGVVYYLIMFLIMALVMTLIEYIAGIIFIKGMHIKLWDYTDEWGNIQGIICPRFTFFWGVLSALYYFLLFPRFNNLVIWFTTHPWFSFTVGTLFGLFIVDVSLSMHLGSVIRNKAAEVDEKAAVDFQKLQQKLHTKKLSIHSGATLSSRIESFEDFVKRAPGRNN